jgi:plastocyanin
MLAAGAACAVALWGAVAVAAPVKGTVSLPSNLKGGRRHLGYWRLENGNVPIQPAPYRGDTVVVIEGLKGGAPAAKTLTVEIAGMAVSTPVVVVGPGSVVELKNNDRVAHVLGISDSPNVMPVERLMANQLRRVRFNEPGGYFIRCEEYPHVSLSVIVVSSPHYAIADEAGAFKISDTPDGKGNLKVWSRGRWVHEEPIEVGGKGADVQVKVTGSEAREREQPTE